MPVVNPIIFKVTDVGRDAAAYAFNNLPGGKLSLSAIKVGLAKYSTVGNETALQNPLPNTFSIGGGGVQVGSGQIRFTPILASLTRIEAFEIGLFTETGILFAVAATPTNIPLLVIEPDIEAIFTMNVALTNVDPDSIEIVVDVNAPLAVVMMGQHISAAHPHSQYKRTNDASERLKVAVAVEADEAIRKDELDALRLRLIANGIDADLSSTNHLPNINVDAFLMPEGFFDEDTLGDKPFTHGLCKTWKENNTVVYQYAQSFTNGDFATRMYRGSLGYWTDWKYYANISGSSTQRFKVADAIDDDEAVSKSQLNSAVSGIPPVDLSGKADLAGSSTQTFSVATATANDHAVRKEQFDAKTGIATDIIAGIVEKATQAELNAGTANVWPDAATILSGFDSQGQSMDLPSFLGNYGIRWGAATQVSAGEGTVSVVYSKPFPNDTLFTTAIIENPAATSSGENDVWAQLVSSDRFGASFYVQSTATLALVKSMRWFAIGR